MWPDAGKTHDAPAVKMIGAEIKTSNLRVHRRRHEARLLQELRHEGAIRIGASKMEKMLKSAMPSVFASMLSLSLGFAAFTLGYPKFSSAQVEIDIHNV